MNIYDFDEFDFGTKLHGGSDKKNSIEVGRNYYIVKQPSKIINKISTQDVVSNSCISEYFSCHIFEILGFEAQHTYLGYYTCHDGIKRLCVACEDFTDNSNYDSEGLFLQCFNDYSHAFNRTAKDFGFTFRKKNDKQKKYGFLDEIDEILDNDLYLKKHPELKEKFYDMFVIDALIENSDRHYYNWGFLTAIQPRGNLAGVIRFAPIYDCGATLYPEATEEFLYQKTIDKNEFEEEIKNFSSSNIIEIFKEANDYKDDSWLKRINYYSYMNSLKNPSLNEAIKRMYPIILDRLPEIYDLIDDMVNSNVITERRGLCYKRIIDTRFTLLVEEPFLKMDAINDKKCNKDSGREM